MAAQVKKPAVVVRLTNQLKTVVAPDEWFMNESKEKRQQNRTATNGRPFFVVYEKIFGAWDRMDKPYKMRDEQNRKELPAEKADVKMAALMTEGSARYIC